MTTRNMTEEQKSGLMVNYFNPVHLKIRPLLLGRPLQPAGKVLQILIACWESDEINTQTCRYLNRKVYLIVLKYVLKASESRIV
jgi:hypothetical protein